MSYPGGKSSSGVYQTIINQIPPHRVYIEPFLGSGAIMRLKLPAACSIGIDIDVDVINAFTDDVITNLSLVIADAISWLASHTISDDAFIYLDPPYLLETRISRKPIYRYEMTTQDHIRLLDVIISLRSSIAISGYWSELYANALPDWRLIQFNARTRGGSTATECLWMNYPEPIFLHDYRYLGSGFRERERIKRKVHRWRNKLEKLKPLERHAIMAAISQLSPPISTFPDLIAGHGAIADREGATMLTGQTSTNNIFDDAISPGIPAPFLAMVLPPDPSSLETR